MQKAVNDAWDALPVKNVSQWVQGRIIEAIVDPILLEMRRQGQQSLQELAEKTANVCRCE